MVPSQLKESQVTPCPKCTLPKTIENDLRPITLICQVAKLMEGFTLDSVYNQIIDQLDDKQFFLPGKSYSHAILYLLHHHILTSLDKGDCFVRILFTDFSKGFALVNHNVLIRELRYLGVQVYMKPVTRRSRVRIPLKPWFFQASPFQLLKLEHLLRWSLFTFIYNRSTNMNYFI